MRSRSNSVSTGTITPSKEDDWREDEDRTISPQLLINSILDGVDFFSIRDLLYEHDPAVVHETITTEKHGYSAIFSAVERGDPNLINLLVQNGGNPNATAESTGVPLLAFGILNSTAKIPAVKALLCLGADPWVIPNDLWAFGDENFSPYDPAYDVDQSSKVGWCSDTLRQSLVKHIDVALKYLLNRSSNLTPPTKHYLQLGYRLGMQVLTRAPYYMVGQKLAVDRVTQYARQHFLLGGNNGPLLMAFMGAPGHGKSELARMVGTPIPPQALVKKSKLPYAPRIKPSPDDTVERQLELELPTRYVVYIDGTDDADYSNLINVLDTPDNCKFVPIYAYIYICFFLQYGFSNFSQMYIETRVPTS